MSDLHIVEHCGNDDGLKFGLRKLSLPQSEHLIVLRASSQETRKLWILTLRELSFDAQTNNNDSDFSGSASSVNTRDRDFLSSMARLQLDQRRHSNGSLPENGGIVLRKASAESASVGGGERAAAEAAEPARKGSLPPQAAAEPSVRATVYSTASSDGDLPPAMDQISAVVSAGAALD